MGIPTKISRNGLVEIQEVNLSEEELEKLRHSATEIKDDLKGSY